ncbi:carbohydrate kinase [Bacillus sp. FJAT-50079]|uniref:carbohydrate kinase family protein n=1 Tax=Bacillus sp. FJAT-50079 TaxID=2833577 RepID=UPI001BC97714|nr:carbohydrate kinase [Bacillus sp. FJAT-50079]MBS4210479.1 carbohydrate kinase [Bacillus sp. FJAT-50079]
MSKAVICIGELLVDFICKDINSNLRLGSQFIKKAGGAPANVAAAISKLGGNASFAGKVGNDPFGAFLEESLIDAGVDTSMVIKDHTMPTTLAFVSLRASGERDFIFNRGADQLYTKADLNIEKVKQAKIVHFGSATALLDAPFQKTYLYAMKMAVTNGGYVTFDPNYREDLWRGRINDFVSLSKECVKSADLVKLSEEELEIITGTKDKNKALKILHDTGAGIITVTLGKQGTLLSNGNHIELVDSINVKSIDSTGAGDAFIGGMLFQLAQLENLEIVREDIHKLSQIVDFSNKVGAITCTKMGAISSLPTYEEVLNLN